MKIKLSNEMKITSKGAETNMIKKSLLTIVALMLAFVLSGGIVASAQSDTAWTDRIHGDDRIETAVEISEAMYPADMEWGPRYVIIARSDHYADALAGAGLVTDLLTVTGLPETPSSTISNGDIVTVENPILLTPSNSLDDRVADEIERLATVGTADFGSGATNDALEVAYHNYYGGLSGAVKTENSGTTVYVLGGEGAISDSVVEDIEDLSGVGDVERIGGDTRYETAAMIDDEMSPAGTYGHERSESNGHQGTVYIATGENFPDALAAGGVAAATRAPILLAHKSGLGDDAMDALDSGDAERCIIVGGTGVLSNDVRDDLHDVCEDVERVGGDDRYETATEFAQAIWGVEDEANNDPAQRFIFARGDDFPDALAGAALAASQANPMTVDNLSEWLSDLERIPTLLTNTSSLNSVTDDYLTDMFEDDGVTAFNESYVLGGTGAISDSAAEDIAEALSDSEFESTDDKPEIDDSTVTVNDVGTDNNCDNGVARADCDEDITIVVDVKDIKNGDGSFGEVTIDTTVLGEDDNTTYVEDFDLTRTGCTGDDCRYEATIEVTTDDDEDDELNSNVSLEITATNQAGSDTADSEEFDIFN